MGPSVYWQLTRTCDLGCRDCLLAADRTRRGFGELSTFEAYKTIDQIAALKPNRLVISGGDPLARNDLGQLVEYAVRRGLDPAVLVMPTEKLSAESVQALKENGAKRLIFNVNGSSPERHDAVYATPGSFGATVRAMRWAREAGVAIEVNTLVTRRTMHDLVAIAEVIEPFGIDAWNVYFLVPVEGSRNLEVITAEEAERVFAALAAIATLAPFRVRTVEAPQYRRYLLQQTAIDALNWSDFSGYVPPGDPSGASIDDVVFISSYGDVRPSEFLPLTGGNVRYRSLMSLYRGNDLFLTLRDRSNLNGKCKRCEYRQVCGGSRARAWAATGDVFASDPLCAYQPQEMEMPA